MSLHFFLFPNIATTSRFAESNGIGSKHPSCFNSNLFP